MPLINSSLPSLVNGVSQQPPSLRLPTQGAAQTNLYPTLVEGNRTRAPSTHVAKMLGTSLGLPYVHTINRDAAERYEVILLNGDLRVFTLGGVERAVSFPDGRAYLTATTPRDSFRAQTIADYTFIVNTSFTVAMDATLSPKRNPEALVNVKSGNYGKTYAITINGTLAASYKTPNGSNSNDVNYVDTVVIADALYNRLINGSYAGPGAGTIAGAGAPGGFSIARYQNAVHIQRTSDTTDFTIAVEDGFNGNAMAVAKNKLQKFTDLPGFGPDGFVVEISGDNNNSFDNYFVKFEKNASADSAGVWRETVKPGVQQQFDATTMPHILVREGDGSFTFKKATFDKRLCGDPASSPDPSFVGLKIADVFFHRDRLGVLAGENVVFTKVGEFFNFFRTTVTAVLDNDPVDVGVEHIKVSILKHAVPLNDLILFSEQTQFKLSAGDLLTPKTASIKVTTEYDCLPNVRPVGAGDAIFFAQGKGSWAAMREFTVDNTSNTNDADDVTVAVPKYVPSDVFKIAASTAEDLLVAVAASTPNILYGYKWYYANRQKVQSAWFKFDLGSDATILSADFIQSDLYLLIERGGETFIEKINMAPGQADPGVSFLTHLDRRFTETSLSGGAYNSAADVTTFTLPFTPPAGKTVSAVVRYRDGYTLLGPGVALEVTDQTGNQISLRGDHRNTPMFLGFAFEHSYSLSPIFYRAATAGSTPRAVTSGRLMLRHIGVVYDRSGSFEVRVTPRGCATYTYWFSGVVVGDSSTPLDSASVQTGIFKVPVMAKNDEVDITVVSTSYLPFGLLSVDWEGSFDANSRRT